MKGREWVFKCESGRHGSDEDSLVIFIDRYDLKNGRATLTVHEDGAGYNDMGEECEAEAHITLSPEALERLAASALEAAAELRRMACDVPAEDEIERARR